MNINAKITIIAIPKKFTGKFKTIQHNALYSWRLFCDDIILFGDDRGVAQAAKTFGARHVAKVKKNEFGTPILSDVFLKAHKIARHNIIAYVNTDVILFSDFSHLIKKVSQQFKKFLFIGKRRNIELNKVISFQNNWKRHLLKALQKQRREKPIGNSSELFVFPKSIDFDIPEFAIGRLYWDSWLIYRARFLKIPVIDATSSLLYLHQIHDYSHHKKGFEGVWYGEEAQKNFTLSGGTPSRFKVTDADYWLTSTGVQKSPVTIRSFIRNLRVLSIINPRLNFLIFPIYVVLLGIFKAVMIIIILPRTNLRRILETLKNPGLMEYKLQEL